MTSISADNIKKYYTDTEYDYRVAWNWKSENIPALHFGYYDDKATTHVQAITRANEVLAQWAGIQRGARIVDAGCGLGHSSFWLLQHYNAEVTGITLVPKQVETIQKFIAEKEIKNVNFLVADYLDMPFEDNSIDVVWAIESLCHAADKSSFYKEAYRILKPGGKLVIAENLRTARPLDLVKEGLLKEIFHAWAIPDIDTGEEHQTNALNAGFKSLEIRDVTANMMVSYRNLKYMCKRWGWLSYLLHTIGAISTVRHKNMIGCSKQLDAIEQNIFTYNHLCAIK